METYNNLKCPNCNSPLFHRGKFNHTFDHAAATRAVLDGKEDEPIQFATHCTGVEYYCSACNRVVISYSASPEDANKRNIRFINDLVTSFGPNGN